MSNENSISNSSTSRRISINPYQKIDFNQWNPPRSHWIEGAKIAGYPENLAIKAYDSYFGGAS